MRNPILSAVPVLVLLAGLAASDSRAKPEGGITGLVQKPLALKLPDGKPMRPTGMAALDISGGSANAYSIEAIQKFLSTHNLPRNSGPSGDIHVVRVEILADRDVSARLDGESTGLGANAKVVLATLSGRFIFNGPRGSYPAEAKYAFAAFDYTSGNLMMIGAFSAAAAKKLDQLK
jgi:hypothetical protein